jgi:hypothetical protein
VGGHIRVDDVRAGLDVLHGKGLFHAGSIETRKSIDYVP